MEPADPINHTDPTGLRMDDHGMNELGPMGGTPRDWPCWFLCDPNPPSKPFGDPGKCDEQDDVVIKDNTVMCVYNSERHQELENYANDAIKDNEAQGSPSPQNDRDGREQMERIKRDHPGIITWTCASTKRFQKPVTCVEDPSHSGGTAHTRGHYIFCTPSGTDCLVGGWALGHELVHVEQFERWGDSFWDLYRDEEKRVEALGFYKQGCANRFEREAYTRKDGSGLPVENCYQRFH